MAGLVGYASSDEEEEVLVTDRSRATAQAPESTTSHHQRDDEPSIEKAAVAPTPESNTTLKASSAESANAGAAHVASEPEPIIGPSAQPDVPLGPSLPTMDEVSMMEQEGSQPSSPYSANRALIQNLTLPTVPNLDIPPSPPGSPPAGTSKRFEQFLELKRKGTHFNSKLEHSTALANPSLMDKLMAFVDIDARQQYATTLPADLWDPQALPNWASAESLKKTREKVVKAREAEQANGGRSSIDFVAASRAEASTPTPGGIARGEKRKSGWN